MNGSVLTSQNGGEGGDDDVVHRGRRVRDLQLEIAVVVAASDGWKRE